MDRIIGIGEYAVSGGLQDILKTYALSSCVAVVAYSRKNRILGMVHIALPNSAIMRDRIITGPAYYADTGVPLLIREMCLVHGCIKDELEISVFGGAESINSDDVFNIGKKNLEMVEAMLEQMELTVCCSDTGRCLSRSVEADVATGVVKVVCQPLCI